MPDDDKPAKVDLDPCEPMATCADCFEAAAGRRKNIDRQPSCRRCEADRLALIEMILDVAKPEATPELAQTELF